MSSVADTAEGASDPREVSPLPGPDASRSDASGSDAGSASGPEGGPGDAGGIVDAGAGGAMEQPDGAADDGGGAPSLDRADTDGDGLSDAWEAAAGDPEQLDWRRADTDADGTPDGQEDLDGDGLTCLAEQAVSRAPADTRPRDASPLRPDLLVELDLMGGRSLGPGVLERAVQAYLHSRPGAPEEPGGVALHVYTDQRDLPETVFDGSFEQRQEMLLNSGPRFDGILEPDFPFDGMVHVIAAARRSDLPSRAGEVVTHGADPERAGVLLYLDALADLFPRCGLEDPPPIRAVSLAEAQAGTLIHELGHALQLGHETEVGGGLNPWNVMAVPDSCASLQRRYHGTDNEDPALGSTSEVAAPRFSQEAAQLFDLRDKLSVETSRLRDGDDGREM